METRYRLKYASDVSSACRAHLDRIEEFAAADGRFLKPFPFETISGKADASALFERLAILFRFATSGSAATRDVLKWSADFLGMAVQYDCITCDDVALLTSVPVQFPLIFAEAFGSRLPTAGEPANIAQHAAMAAVYVDLVLFIAELHGPGIDRLRKTRVKLDVDAMAWTWGAKPGAATPSPEPKIATLGWERLLRGHPGFRKDTRTLLGLMHSQFEGVAPYWTFSLATKLHDTPFLFMAFDKGFQYDQRATRTVKEALATRKTRYYVRTKSADPVLRESENFLLFFCRKYNVEMIGTPFLTPSLDDELHILAQQVAVTHRHNAIEVVIPAFYTGNHLAKYLDRDFHDLNRILSRKLSVSPVREVKRPDDDACPLNEDELSEAAKTVRKVLKKSYGLSPYRSFRYAEIVMSLWWPWRLEVRTTVGQKTKRSIKLVDQTADGASTRMTHWIRQPAPTSEDLRKDKMLKTGYPLYSSR